MRYPVLLIAVLLSVPAAAHVPAFPEGNTAPERAQELHQPTKSWSFYGSLAPGQARYFRMQLEPGETLWVGTFTPAQNQFRPSLVVMRSVLNTSAGATPQVSIPAGMGATVVHGERPGTARYEPFAPSALYHTASYRTTVDTRQTVIVAVYEPANRSGQVGVTIGSRESFTLKEYLTVPFDLVRTKRWEGVSIPVLLLPWILTALALAAAGYRARDRLDPAPRRLLLTAGGYLVLGAGVATLFHTIIALTATGWTPAVAVTAIYILVPKLCGGYALRHAGREQLQLSIQQQLVLGLAALLSLATWAGFIIGPLMLATAAVLAGRER